MNTLTKILIVLLTVSSIFLCGIVVTYVGNASNYKQKYNELKSDRDSLDKKVGDLTKQVNEALEKKQQAEEKLNGEMTALKASAAEMETNLKNAERERAELLQKVNGWVSIVEDFHATNSNLGKLLESTLKDLKGFQADQIKMQKELKETTAALMEKMAVIETLQTENRRLLEDKSELQNKVEKPLQPKGKVAAAPVVKAADKVKPAVADRQDAVIQGTVKKVDLKNSMASISIGSANGVREGMVFHVSRDNEFVCDILVIDVDTDQAVGALELLQKQPAVGDSASTNL